MAINCTVSKFIKHGNSYHVVSSYQGHPNTDECQILSINLDNEGCIRSLVLKEAAYESEYIWSGDGKFKKILSVDTVNILDYHLISDEIHCKDIDGLIKHIESNMVLSTGDTPFEDLLVIANEYVINQHSHGLVNEYLGSIKKMTNGSVVECSSIGGEFNNALSITESSNGVLLVSNIRFTFESDTDENGNSISGVLMRVTTYRAGIIDGVVTELDNNPYHAVLETDEVNAFFSNADYTKQQPLYNQLMSNIFNKES